MPHAKKWEPEPPCTETNIQMGGFQNLKDRIKAMQEAGKRLIEHRCMASGHELPDGEILDGSIFGKRYYDNIDLAELEKKHKDNIENRIAYTAAKKSKQKADTQENATSGLASEALSMGTISSREQVPKASTASPAASQAASEGGKA